MDEPTGHEGLIDRLGGLARPIHPARQASDLAAMTAAAAPRTGLFASKVRIAAAFLAGLLLGSTGLAAADVLPDPAQHVAHQVLDRVGVQVPDPERYHGPECGSEVKRNHGAYVRDDHALATTDCGKPAGAGARGGAGAAKAKAERGPCGGPPPWAVDRGMSPEAKAAAQAERAAACPEDAEAEAAEDAAEAEAEAAEDAVEAEAERSEAEAPTTTTEAPSTTEVSTTTTSDETTTTSTP
jgi:hypothetical protein